MRPEICISNEVPDDGNDTGSDHALRTIALGDIPFSKQAMGSSALAASEVTLRESCTWVKEQW